MNNQLNCKVGIYDTYASLTRHRDGSITLRLPGVKWSGNTGTLVFTRHKIRASKLAEMVKATFDADDGVSLDDPRYITQYDISEAPGLDPDTAR